jgi:hypothetical protein
MGEGNIEIGHEEIRNEGVEWMHPAQEGVKLRAAVSTVMNVWLS